VFGYSTFKPVIEILTVVQNAPSIGNLGRDSKKEFIMGCGSVQVIKKIITKIQLRIN